MCVCLLSLWVGGWCAVWEWHWGFQAGACILCHRSGSRLAREATVDAVPLPFCVPCSLEHRRHKIDPTILGLQEMLTYGLRGLAAYTHHAAMLGQRSATVDKFIAEAYAFLCSPDASDVGKVGTPLQRPTYPRASAILRQTAGTLGRHAHGPPLG